ncbi:MAG: hypothetical protein KAW84_08775 [Thermoplasmata archaeon]|nr:hypothetical protein [Thermoplasmata archaeon]
MAKKRHRVEEKVVFKRPDFDEKEYMRKELLNAKVGIITFFYALPYGVVSWQLTLADLSILGFLAVIVGILSLRYVYPYFGVDVEKFEKKTWFGNGAVLVFTWLSIWVLLLNPPFSDMASPDITKVQVIGSSVNWTKVSRGDHENLDVVAGDDNVRIKAKVVDNVGISRVEIQIRGVSQEVGLIGGEEPHYYGSSFTVTVPPNTTDVVISAWDEAGHKSTFSFTLRFM